MGLLDGAANAVQKGRDFLNQQTGLKKDGGTVRPEPDFKSGFVVEEYVNGKVQQAETVRLVGNMMPVQPFKFGGSQKIVKHYYAGNPEPSVHILGPQETDITVTGRWKAKRLSNFTADGQNAQQDLRTVPEAIQKQFDALRIRGNLLRISLGEWYRYGYLTDVSFDLKTKADIDYSLTFSIVGFNPPKRTIVVGRSQDVPIDINKQLIASYADFQTKVGQLPDGFNQDLASQIEGFANDLGAAVQQVTDFIDGYLQTVQDLNNAVNRVLGVVRNAQLQVLRFQRQIGNISFVSAAILGAGGISNASASRAYLTNVSSGAFDLTAFLQGLIDQFSALRLTTPLARYRVKANDTLQSIAVDYYNNASMWEKIYEHNDLTSTDLDVGSVIEIPRV